jgi:hypothetical protein
MQMVWHKVASHVTPITLCFVPGNEQRGEIPPGFSRGEGQVLKEWQG